MRVGRRAESNYPAMNNPSTDGYIVQCSRVKEEEQSAVNMSASSQTLLPSPSLFLHCCSPGLMVLLHDSPPPFHTTPCHSHSHSPHLPPHSHITSHHSNTHLAIINTTNQQSSFRFCPLPCLVLLLEDVLRRLSLVVVGFCGSIG